MSFYVQYSLSDHDGDTNDHFVGPFRTKAKAEHVRDGLERAIQARRGGDDLLPDDCFVSAWITSARSVAEARREITQFIDAFEQDGDR